MSFYKDLSSWETEFQSVIRPMRDDDNNSHLYASTYAAHLEDLHSMVQAYLVQEAYLGENKPKERKPGEVKLSKPWTSQTGQTRVYVNGLGLGKGYKVFFHMTDASTVDCRMTLPKEVWQDSALRNKEQARFEEIKTELIATHETEVKSLIAKEN